MFKLPKRTLVSLLLCSLLWGGAQSINLCERPVTYHCNQRHFDRHNDPGIHIGHEYYDGPRPCIVASHPGYWAGRCGCCLLNRPVSCHCLTWHNDRKRLIVINSLAYGAYIPLSRNLVKRYGALNVMTWLFVMGTVVTMPLTIYSWSGVQVEQLPLNTWLTLVYIILVPTVGAYYLNAWALMRVSPGIVAIYIYLQPLMAFGLAPLFLGESLNSRTIVACVLIFAGVAVVTLYGHSRAVEEVSEHPEALAH